MGCRRTFAIPLLLLATSCGPEPECAVIRKHCPAVFGWRVLWQSAPSLEAGEIAVRATLIDAKSGQYEKTVYRSRKPDKVCETLTIRYTVHTYRVDDVLAGDGAPSTFVLVRKPDSCSSDLKEKVGDSGIVVGKLAPADPKFSELPILMERSNTRPD